VVSGVESGELNKFTASEIRSLAQILDAACSRSILTA
jgi:hypothetical protein